MLVEVACPENCFERDRFPETTVFVEGNLGSAELALDYGIRVTTREGTQTRRCPPPR
ncbi:MAG TPA: hypothetical protein PLA43_03120 [Bryobacteraceae bacterium]|nr:hypothetical protein [Bryobacteraceae bacterium]HOQ45870.1 hypothetical protein [Bryobacteraceae bacterium]HPQ15470.1 hypothetical protein [Bryobacteraceae bacterium]HPU70921.1 hypothetical protein [Bryobacteraceae bacterium]